MTEFSAGPISEERADAVRAAYHMMLDSVIGSDERTQTVSYLVEAVTDEEAGEAAANILFEVHKEVPDGEEKVLHSTGLLYLAFAVENYDANSKPSQHFATRMLDLAKENPLVAGLLHMRLEEQQEEGGRHVLGRPPLPMKRHGFPEYADDPNLPFPERLEKLANRFDVKLVDSSSRLGDRLDGASDAMKVPGTTNRHRFDVSWITKMILEPDMLRRMIDSGGMSTDEGLRLAEYTHDRRRATMLHNDPAGLAQALVMGQFLTKQGRRHVRLQHDEALLQSRTGSEVVLGLDIEEDRFLTGVGRALAEARYDEHLLDLAHNDPERVRAFLDDDLFLSNMGKQEAHRLLGDEAN